MALLVNKKGTAAGAVLLAAAAVMAILVLLLSAAYMLVSQPPHAAASRRQYNYHQHVIYETYLVIILRKPPNADAMDEDAHRRWARWHESFLPSTVIDDYYIEEPRLLDSYYRYAVRGKFDCCRHSHYGDCGDESCENFCIPNDTSSVLLHGLSQAKILELGAMDDMYIFRRDLKCCPTFTRLKSLKFNEHWCEPDIHVLARTLALSPILEELYLFLFYKMLELNVIMKGRKVQSKGATTHNICTP